MGSVPVCCGWCFGKTRKLFPCLFGQQITLAVLHQHKHTHRMLSCSLTSATHLFLITNLPGAQHLVPSPQKNGDKECCKKQSRPQPENVKAVSDHFERLVCMNYSNCTSIAIWKERQDGIKTKKKREKRKNLVWKETFVPLCIACKIFVCFAHFHHLSKPGKKEKERKSFPLMTSPGLFSNPYLYTVQW